MVFIVIRAVGYVCADYYSNAERMAENRIFRVLIIIYHSVGIASIALILFVVYRMKAEGGDGVYGTITVKQSGMASKGSSTCTVNLQIPVIAVRNYFVAGGTKYLVMAELWLDAGGFTENATAENVTLADGAIGAISVTLSDGMLRIEVTDCNVKTPSVILNAQVTTFNKEYTLKLAPFSSTRI